MTDDDFATEPTQTGCDACREGRHVDCIAEAGDCTNTCHPEPR